ncbi:hypothetical protein [Nocardia tengchongensis]|uniref:hypothetical protein n=1 Tax=Nocardia tengchongensis TaxID=2055889 RepID=UPI003653EB29
MSDYTSDEYRQIANIIIQQLCGGGPRQLVKAIGACEIETLRPGLRFRFPDTATGINTVSIELTPMDFYRMEFGTLKRIDYTRVLVHDGLDSDQLTSVFESATGLTLA